MYYSPTTHFCTIVDLLEPPGGLVTTLDQQLQQTWYSIVIYCDYNYNNFTEIW